MSVNFIMKKYVLALFILPMLFAFISTPCAASMATPEEITLLVNENTNQMMYEIEKMISNNSPYGISSNPYSYIQDNQYYENIIKLGYDALPILRDKIKFSRENGLKEYILAIAMEEIAQVDLKKDTFQWANGKEFEEAWEKHLKTIPYNVKSIVFSGEDDEVKINKLIKLGVMAIPFVMDYVEKGYVQFAPVLDELLKDNPYGFYDKNVIKDYRLWVTDNKDKFDNLRKMVNSEIE